MHTYNLHDLGQRFRGWICALLYVHIPRKHLTADGQDIDDLQQQIVIYLICTARYVRMKDFTNNYV